MSALQRHLSRRSTATVRERPVSSVSSASGTMRVLGETFTVETSTRVEIVDLTERITAIVTRLGVRDGLVTLASLHTTCALFINESQHALRSDMLAFLEHVVDPDAPWLHNDPEHSDCDRANADAHLRAMFLGHSLSLQLCEGEIVLGQWQRILMAELDGPRPRTLRIQALGI